MAFPWSELPCVDQGIGQEARIIEYLQKGE
jgi:hypothetical protein